MCIEKITWVLNSCSKCFVLPYKISKTDFRSNLLIRKIPLLNDNEWVILCINTSIPSSAETFLLRKSGIPAHVPSYVVHLLDTTLKTSKHNAQHGHLDQRGVGKFRSQALRRPLGSRELCLLTPPLRWPRGLRSCRLLVYQRPWLGPIWFLLHPRSAAPDSYAHATASPEVDIIVIRFVFT